jgi:DHA2 family multidrug resistance protein
MFSDFSQGIVQQMQNVYMGMGQSFAEARSSAIGYITGQIQIQSTVQAMGDVFYISMWLALFALFISFFIGKKEEPKKEETVAK